MTGAFRSPKSPRSESSLDFLDYDDEMDERAGFMAANRGEQRPMGGHSRKDTWRDDADGGGNEESLSALRELPSLKQVRRELWRLWDLGAPVVGMQLLTMSRLLLSLVFLGHLGQLELAAGSLAISFASITGFSFLWGLGSGMEPICSQAFGAQQHAAMSHTLQRSVLLLLIASVPIAFLWANGERLLILVGQEPGLSHLAGRYLRYLTPDLFMMSIFVPFATYLRSQGITRPLMWCSLAAVVLHVPINFVLIYGAGLGAIGSAIANFVFTLVLLIFLIAFVHHSGALEDRWEGLSKECLRDWRPLLRLAIPSCLTVCLEWWCYEIMTFLAGLLPNPAVSVATMAILLQLGSLSYAVLLGLASSVCTLVGNELGSNHPAAARRLTIVSLCLSGCAGLITALLFFIFREKLGWLFTTDKAVLAMLPSMLILLSFNEIFNWLQVTMVSVLRGSARPVLSSMLYLVCFYAVAIPLALVLTFRLGMGLQGLWVALIVANFLLTFCAIVVTVRTDWVLEAHKAQGLVRMDDTEFVEWLGDDEDATPLSPKDDGVHLVTLPPGFAPVHTVH